MYTFSVTVYRHATPFETWESEAPNADTAIEQVRSHRTATEDHSLFDTYQATDAAIIIDDAEALAHAFAHAATLLPALAEIGAYPNTEQEPT